MKNFLWQILAFILSRPRIAEWLIKRAQLTPYRNLEGYMDRWWLYNPYFDDKYVRKTNGRPSIRVHHIKRPDLDQHLHDHPWNARTIILKGWYIEERAVEFPNWAKEPIVKRFMRNPGDTAEVLFGQYHQIVEVSQDGVWTLFFTWEFQGMWGFFVNGKKIPFKDYLSGMRE